MAEQRLFNGQINPGSRPIGTFVQPRAFNVGGVGRTPMLPQVSKIATLQQAGTSSVRGFNQAEQLANALAPLNKNLTNVLTTGYTQYAKGSIEAGYYDELKNQQVRGVMSLQQQQEAGAADAAQMQTDLAKTDPVAAGLLREANPWKAIGRRRALAQLAASEVSSTLAADLTNNPGLLSSYKPGSPELMQRKADLTQGILNRYGLTGDESESAVYVTPVINKTWDKYTEQQSKLYTEEIYRSSVDLTGAAAVANVRLLAQEGVLLPSGERIKPGDDRFGDAAGLILTKQIDEGLSSLGGEDKTKAMKVLRQNLALLRSQNIPGVSDAIENIRLGSSRDPMEERPRWNMANPMELLDFTNTALKAENEFYSESQKRIEQTLDQMWEEGPGSMVYGSPEYQKAVANFESQARDLGYRDVEDYLNTRTGDDESITIQFGGQNPISYDERVSFESAINDLKPENFSSPEDVQALRQMYAELARREATPELAAKKNAEYQQKITAAQKRFAGLPSGSDMRSRVNGLVRESLNDPQISNLKGKMQWNPLLNAPQMQGEGAPNRDERAYYEFSNLVKDLYTRTAFAKFQQWRNENGGADIPIDVQSQLIQEAGEEVRASELYKKLRGRALGLKDDGTAPTPAPTVDPNTTPVPAAAAPSVPAARARQYRDQPLMNPSWMYQELTTISKGNRVSRELFDISKEAGVLPYRFLLEQLKFYPQLDPSGEARGWLEKELEDLKSGQTPAATYGDQSSSPRAPGAWLNAMVMPVQMSRLPNGEAGPAQGPFTPVQQYPGGGYMPDGREPGAPAPTPIRTA